MDFKKIQKNRFSDNKKFCFSQSIFWKNSQKHDISIFLEISGIYRTPFPAKKIENIDISWLPNALIIFTNRRTAAELCERIAVFFNMHPAWLTTASDDTPRYIRGNPKISYKSEEFLRLIAQYNYSIEHSTTWE